MWTHPLPSLLGPGVLASVRNSGPVLDKLLKLDWALAGALTAPPTVVWVPEVPPFDLS